jgi:hypothetical protein
MLAAYAGLFAWSFAAATFLPLSSELPLAVLVHQQGSVMVPVAVATIGNYLGAAPRTGSLQAWSALSKSAGRPLSAVATIVPGT